MSLVLVFCALVGLLFSVYTIHLCDDDDGIFPFKYSPPGLPNRYVVRLRISLLAVSG